MVTAGAVAARPVDASVEKEREESPRAAITTPRKSAKQRPPHDRHQHRTAKWAGAAVLR
jgi:hypothetical protein